MLSKTFACAGLAIAGAGSAHAAAPVQVEPAAMSEALLDAVQDISAVPGLSAAVWRDGRVVWTGASGMRDVGKGLPVEHDTRFRLASVSKLFTVAAVARLAEEGRIDLDAPVRSVLPWLVNDWPAMTARQLAAHTSGLPHYQEIDAGRGAVRYGDGRSAVGVFGTRPLLSPPGERYSYSSWGYTLLGAMVEEVTGKPFNDYVARIVAPGLGVGADATDSGQPGVSVAYEFADGAPRPAGPHDYSYTWGGGGLMASAAAVAGFGGAMLENRIVTKATFDMMVAPALLSSGEPAGTEEYQVGFGWRSARDHDGQPVVFHNGGTSGARSSLVLWRDEGVASTILSNAAWTSSIDSTAQMLAAPFRNAPQGLVAAACPTRAVRFDGVLSGEAVSGAARFELVDGSCRGTLELTGRLRAHFGRGVQPAAGELRVIGLDRGGGLSRAGLVTPFGIYDLRATDREGFRSVWSSSQVLDFRLVPAEEADTGPCRERDAPSCDYPSGRKSGTER